MGKDVWSLQLGNRNECVRMVRSSQDEVSGGGGVERERGLNSVLLIPEMEDDEVCEHTVVTFGAVAVISAVAKKHSHIHTHTHTQFLVGTFINTFNSPAPNPNLT